MHFAVDFYPPIDWSTYWQSLRALREGETLAQCMSCAPPM